MSESLTLSLPALARSSSDQPSLNTKIQQIIVQRGAFRHITEQSLQKEIAEASSGLPEDETAQQSQDLDEEDEDESLSACQEKLWKGREEMLAQLSRAQNDVLCALDFVSFVIARQYVPAQSSMSPLLKQSVPVGSMEAHVLPPRETASTFRTQLTAVAQGWKTDSFQKASEKLAFASSRLHSEGARESKFWEHIAQLQQQGWSVSRLPRDSRAIGVHFGFAESNPQFRNRGFALLRQNEDGGLYIDRALSKEPMKTLKVYVRQGVHTGSFMISSSLKPGVDVIQQLRKDRDALFEEELFYEICREARGAANRGIITRSGAVEVGIGPDFTISIEMSQREMEKDDHLDTNNVAQFVGLTLQSLLTIAHGENLTRRSRPPLPISSRPSTTPEHALLRPIVAYLRHQVAVTMFKKSCSDIFAILRRNSFETKIVVENASLSDNQILRQKNSAVAFLLTQARTTLNFRLPTGKNLNATIETHLGPPLYGTRIQLSELAYTFAAVKASTHDCEERAISSLCHIAMLDIMACIQGIGEGIQAASETNSDWNQAGAPWRITQAHGGELMLHKAKNDERRIKIAVTPHSLTLEDLSKGGRAQCLWTWTIDGRSVYKGVKGVESNNQAFPDVVKSIAAR